MAETLKNPNVRPVGTDMSMDDILLSIRKIIASEDSVSAPSAPNSGQQNYTKNIGNATETTAKPTLKVPLSSREQLRSLSQDFQNDDVSVQHFTPISKNIDDDFRDMAQNQYNAVRANIDGAGHNPNSTKTNQNMNDTAFRQNTQKNTSQDTADILKTLEDIRNSLTMSDMQKKNNIQADYEHHDVMDSQNMDNSAHNTIKTIPTLIQDFVQNSEMSQQDHSHIDNDLKAVQFSGDQIPSFLKRFKKEQNEFFSAKSEQNQPQDSVPDYDLSKIRAFHEDDTVVELTTSVNPDDVKNDTHKSHAMIALDNDKIDDGMSDALEMLMIKSLRPMLREWIDNNLEAVAKQILREELTKRNPKKL